MKDTEFAFAVAKIRANESKLLTSDVIENLIQAQSYDVCVKLLRDAAFIDSEENGIDEILDEKLMSAYELVIDAAPEKNCLDFLIVQNDFHNVKCAIKSFILKKDPEKLFVKPSICDTQIVKSAIEKKDFSILPEFLRKSTKEAFDVTLKTMDGQKCDIILDKYALLEKLRLAKVLNDDLCLKIANLMIAISDIKIAIRSIRAGKDAAFFEDSLCECDYFSVGDLINASLESEEKLLLFLKDKGFERLCTALKKSLSLFEKEADNMLLQLVSDAKYSSFGVSPLIAYCLAFESQIKNVRIILSCKYNGYDVKEIRERVRDCYV